MKIKLTGLLLLLFVSAVFAVHKDDKKKTDETTAATPTEGVVYSLPLTGIRIQVEATQETFFHGPYNKYAETLLGVKNAPSSDYSKWVISDIKLKTFSEADPSHVYKAMGDAAALLSLTESGVISGINVEEVALQDELAVSTFMLRNQSPAIPFPDLSMSAFYEKGDSAMSNMLMPKSFEEKAVDAADAITKLRKRRFKSLANAYEEQLPDGRAYEVMVDELAQLEKDYVALFLGKSYKTKKVYSFDFIPGSKSVSGEVVFRFSETGGVLPKTDLSGKPVVIDLKKLDSLSSAQNKLKDSASPLAGKSGIYYRMPGKTEIRLINGLSLMATSRATIAQFGAVAPFPESFLDGNYQVKYHSKTGAIKSILEK